MSGAGVATRTVVVEREFPHPPERVWTALTQPELIADWLMPCDFRAEAGHRFCFAAAWGTIDCRVLSVDPPRSLAYSWTGHDVDTVVTWTLEPTPRGTRLRMEQAGFRADQGRAFAGATGGWPRFLDRLRTTLSPP